MESIMRIAFSGWLVILLAAGSVANALADEKEIRKRMQSLFPDEELSSVQPSSVPGLFEVMIGASLLYMSDDGRYVIRGDMIDLKKRINLSDQKRELARKKVLAALDQSELIEFGPSKKKARHTLYVYTDIDCGYCRKLHREVPELNKAGIAVRYLAFPRKGLKSDSFDKAVAVWCAHDRQKAMTAAKAGETVEATKCSNPVADHYTLGQTMGVTGTPAVYTQGGRQLGGYIPAAELIKDLN